MSDLHLGPTCPKDASGAAARVIEAHPDHELFLTGDTFDLSLNPPAADPAAGAIRILADHPEFTSVLRARLERGVPVVLFSGNHDAQLAQPNVRGEILAALGVPEAVPFECGIWCKRRSDVHFEHGNIYDPDNAPTHPLAAPSRNTEPLGVTLMRRVLAPSKALFFAHAHELTPLKGLSQAFVELGPRAPELITRYYVEAARVFLAATPRTFESELSLGDARFSEFSSSYGSDTDALRRLLAARALPRHHRRSAVFGRLYLDRSMATAIWWSSSLVGLATLSPAAWFITAVSLSYLAGSLSLGKNRYGGSLLVRMREAAQMAARIVGARAVVFGHTHVEEACPGYVNTGSFAFAGPHGRSYLILDQSGSLLRARVDQGAPPERLDVLLPGHEETLLPPPADSMVA